MRYLCRWTCAAYPYACHYAYHYAYPYPYSYPCTYPDLLLAPAKVPRNCQIWRSDGEYGRDIAILGNPVAAYSDPVTQ